MLYNSKMSDPKIWGPPLWREFHTKALFNPTQETRQELMHFNERLPCLMCAMHFQTLMGQYPVPGDPRHLFEWSVFIHNQVNAQLKKPQVSLCEARKLFLG